MKTNINISAVTNRKDYDDAYAESWAGRLRNARHYQNRSIAPLTDLDELEKACKGRCPTCGEKASRDDLQISHWIPDGQLSKNNTFLQCGKCNNFQRSIQINFLIFKKVTGMTFLKYYQKHEDSLIEQLNLTPKDVQRIWNRINSIKS